MPSEPRRRQWLRSVTPQLEVSLSRYPPAESSRRTIAACVVDKFQPPGPRGRAKPQRSRKCSCMPRHHSFADGQTWPVRPVTSASSGGLSLPPFDAFFFPFHTPGGAISLPRQDYCTGAGIGGLLIDKNSAIRAFVVTLDIHS